MYPTILNNVFFRLLMDVDAEDAIFYAEKQVAPNCYYIGISWAICEPDAKERIQAAAAASGKKLSYEIDFYYQKYGSRQLKKLSLFSVSHH